MCNYYSNPALTNVIFRSNQASLRGGGMYNETSNPALTNVTFTGNQARDGGGMCNYFSSPILTNVTLSSNEANSIGGGMENLMGGPTLTNVAFIGNKASSAGGGMHNVYGDATLTNVTFSGNRADYGGGMYNSLSRPTLTNVTFSGNLANYSGGGTYNVNDGNSTLVNSILWGDSPDEINSGGVPIITYSDVYTPTGIYSGTGNINADPQFVAPITATAAPTTTGNYRLRTGSPAIDAGNTLSVTAPTDLDSNPRVHGAAVDMGAYEYQAALSLAVTKQASPDPVRAGAQLTYTLRVTNTGDLDLHVVITDTLPDHVTPIGMLTWTATLAAPGGTWSQPIVVTVTRGYSGTLTNRVQVTTVEGVVSEAQVIVNSIGYKVYLPIVLRQ